MRVIRFASTGGPEVLETAQVGEPAPGPRQLLVEVAAAGVNFIDTYHRGGLYPVDLPFVPGVEGAGTVQAVGEGVTAFRAGDRVAWAQSPGSYADKCLVDEGQAVRVPEEVDLEAAAAVLLQGMTAHYLALDTFPLRSGQRCLVHAGAGGVGLLLIQLAKRRDAEVFTTVGTEEKADLATRAGADHVVRYREEDFAEGVRRVAGSERPLDVVYDGVGRAVFSESLGLLRPRGMMVQFGNASGPVDPISPLELMRGGSLFLTRPTLRDYVATREDLERRAADLFRWVGEGSLEVRIGTRLPLERAGEAHRLLEGRQTTGKVILVP